MSKAKQIIILNCGRKKCVYFKLSYCSKDKTYISEVYAIAYAKALECLINMQYIFFVRFNVRASYGSGWGFCVDLAYFWVFSCF